MVHQESNPDRETTTKEEDIDYYCKQFEDFMQEQPHRKYDLRYSKKRSREPKQQEGTSPQVVPPILNKGKGKLNPNPSKIEVSSNEEITSSEGHIEKERKVERKKKGEKEREREIEIEREIE